MIDVPELRRLYRVTRFDFWIAVAAILGVLSAGVLAGVVIGVVLSLGWLIYVATQPPMPTLGREPGTQSVPRPRREPGRPRRSTVLPVLRLDGGLFFATAEALENRVRGLVDDNSSLRALVLDLEGVNFVDSQGQRSSPRSTSSSRSRVSGSGPLVPSLRCRGAPRRWTSRQDRAGSPPRQRPPRRRGRARRHPEGAYERASDRCLISSAIRLLIPVGSGQSEARAPAGGGDVRARRRHVADERVDLGGGRGSRTRP